MKKQENKKEEVNHAEENAKGWYETIEEQVAAMEMDWNRYKELKETDVNDLTEEEKEELKELEETAREFENYDDVIERIQEEPLSVHVRSGWYNPGENEVMPEEFEILLSTGGPALRMIGDLDEHLQPCNCRLEHQDWFKPWTEYHDVDSDVLEKWANVFYFGN
jgi:hypothetical protein